MQIPYPNIASVRYVSLTETLTYCFALLDDPQDGFGGIHWLEIRLLSPTSICCISLGVEHMLWEVIQL